MFAGEFPNKLLHTFEQIARAGGKRPKGVGKMNLYSCSRELEYALSQMFEFDHHIKLPGEPVGRVKAGSTFVWELYRSKSSGEYYIQTLLFQPPGTNVELEEHLAPVEMVLQNRTSLATYRAQYERAIKDTGDWKVVCDVKEPVKPRAWWFKWVVLALVTLAVTVAYRRGYRRGYDEL